MTVQYSAIIVVTSHIQYKVTPKAAESDSDAKKTIDTRTMASTSGATPNGTNIAINNHNVAVAATAHLDLGRSEPSRLWYSTQAPSATKHDISVNKRISSASLTL